MAHYLVKNSGNFENDFVVELTERRHSFEELYVLLLLHQSGPYHDGAEARSLNGPQLGGSIEKKFENVMGCESQRQQQRR